MPANAQNPWFLLPPEPTGEHDSAPNWPTVSYARTLLAHGSFSGSLLWRSASGMRNRSLSSIRAQTTISSAVDCGHSSSP